VELYPDSPRLEMFARNQWEGWWAGPRNWCQPEC